MRIVDYQQLPVIGDFPTKGRAAVTVGVFDGIHRGHMKLLREVTADPDLDSYVVTFRENPKRILYPETFFGCLLTKRQKLEHLAAHGIDSTVLIDFSADFSKLRGEEFFDYVTSHIPMVKLIVGSNFRCGIGASFTSEMIRHYFSGSRVETVIVEQLVHDDKVRISSSYVRLLIRKGEMKKAAELLDKTYSLDLTECRPSITEPDTLRIHPSDIMQLLPPPGLYAVELAGSIRSGENSGNDDAASIPGKLLITEDLLSVQLDRRRTFRFDNEELLIIEKIG